MESTGYSLDEKRKSFIQVRIISYYYNFGSFRMIAIQPYLGAMML